ncbi:MAG TPA: hypothetical protein DCZ91_19040 [Lachnospiraceae bacterium]|nr:hypothetical protein [Lachnospiraceae bacterium]
MIWEGYELETGIYKGYEYGIVFPEKEAPGHPYVWRTEFFGAFPSVDLAMLKEGYAIVYYRISDMYGSPKAVELMEAFQPFIREKYGLSAQAVLFGFSRGGLYALHYGAKCPERIAALYLDAPVVDIYSWPGGCFSGEGSPEEWEDCRKLWGLSHENYLDTVYGAVDRLLTWSVPLIIVAGGKDETVPWQENGRLLQKAYERGGAAFQLIMKPECGHHPHSLENPSPVVNFLLKNRNYPTWGNALRINDQSKTGYPLTLIIHDRAHLELVTEAERIFGGRYPLGYVGTSPWPGSVTNQKTMPYTESQNAALYDFLREQMEIGQVLYGLSIDGEGRDRGESDGNQRDRGKGGGEESSRDKNVGCGSGRDRLETSDHNSESDDAFFTRVFGNYYDEEAKVVHIRDFSVVLPVIYEYEDGERYSRETLPLFKGVYFNHSIEIPEKRKKLSGKPVVAFHSYKGGVGRILALTSLVKEISSIYGNEKTVLIIDSDLEAPGLTWTIEKSGQFPISYLDFLSIIRTYGNDKKTVSRIAELMQRNLIFVETEKERVQHYFLPAYVEESQLMEPYARPEQILDVSEDIFLISEAV